MAFTETKRKYLLTIALLGPSPSQSFRPIDLAVRLGVSRASVSRMLLAFVKEGVLTQKEHTYQLSPQALTQIKDALSQYAICHAYCTRVLQLSDYDAHECSVALLCTMEPQTCAHLCHQMETLLPGRQTPTVSPV